MVLKNMSVLNDKQPVLQSNRLMNTTNCKNIKSVSSVRKHVGLSDSDISKVNVRGKANGLCLNGEHASGNSDSALELKCTFPLNYMTKPAARNQLKQKIKKRLSNVNYNRVCSNLKCVPRKLSLSKCLDNAIEWYTKTNSSGAKQEDTHRLQENLVPVEDVPFGHSMCSLVGRANGKDIQCFCCAQGKYDLCVYNLSLIHI